MLTIATLGLVGLLGVAAGAVLVRIVTDRHDKSETPSIYPVHDMPAPFVVRRLPRSRWDDHVH